MPPNAPVRFPLPPDSDTRQASMPHPAQYVPPPLDAGQPPCCPDGAARLLVIKGSPLLKLPVATNIKATNSNKRMIFDGLTSMDLIPLSILIRVELFSPHPYKQYASRRELWQKQNCLVRDQARDNDPKGFMLPCTRQVM